MRLRRHGRLLAFGGCYSNLEATKALLAQAEKLGIDLQNMICTGDIVAYGADAAATLGLIRSAGIASVMGNCEDSLSRKADDCGCGFTPGSACDALAVQWFAHAKYETDDGDRLYMANLPREIDVDLDGRTLKFVHGNLDRMNAFVFPSASDLELQRQIALAGCDIVVAGHSGIPFTRRLGEKIWHNAGSIGMPANDGTRRGWFSIIDASGDEISIDILPLEYDYASAAQAMRVKRLPEEYAVALETGIWPSLDILPAADQYFTGVPMERRSLDDAPPAVSLDRLETIWINTGTLCNLTCVKCFMASSPINDSLVYFTLDDFKRFLADAPASIIEVGFTGGEPFMNPDIMLMLELSLEAGLNVLVLTNAMRPLHRHRRHLASLLGAYPGRIKIRVSLDHYRADRHEELRGKGSFASSIHGLKFLIDAGAVISVASRTPWGETETMMRAGFSDLFAVEGIAFATDDPNRLILFPEMDEAISQLPVTSRAVEAVPEAKPLMCRTSRMLVRRKGAELVDIAPCTLLPGMTLQALEAVVSLDHPHCAQFCVYGGASCAGAPG